MRRASRSSSRTATRTTTHTSTRTAFRDPYDMSSRGLTRTASRVMTRVPPSTLPVFLRFQLYTPTVAFDTYELNDALAFRAKSHNSVLIGITFKFGPLGFRWEFMIRL